MNLTEEAIQRYSRHIILPEVGGRGQRRLMEAKVLLVGLGATGSAAALYLAAAGVGEIALCDDGDVSAESLTSGIAHTHERLGWSRAASVAEPLRAINPHAQVSLVAKADLASSLASFPLVVATTGEFASLNETVLRHGGTLVLAATHGATGAVTIVRAGEPCYHCLDARRAVELHLIPELDGERSVAAAAGVIGTAAATEVVKLLLRRGTPLCGRVLIYDGWQALFEEVPFERTPNCTVCGA